MARVRIYLRLLGLAVPLATTLVRADTAGHRRALERVAVAHAELDALDARREFL